MLYKIRYHLKWHQHASHSEVGATIHRSHGLKTDLPVLFLHPTETVICIDSSLEL